MLYQFILQTYDKGYGFTYKTQLYSHHKLPIITIHLLSILSDVNRILSNLNT